MIKGVEKKININGSLPIGWKIAQVKDICDIIRGVSYKKPDSIQEAQKGYLPMLRATNIQDNSLVLDKDLVYVPTDLVSENQKLKIGDIVIATSSGSKHLVGKTAQVKRNWLGAFGAFCAAIRSTVEVDHRYLGYFFNSPAYKDVIAAKAIGVNINNLRRGDIEELKIPIAPLKEQKRIVAEIEKQFSRLDESVANLKRVKANLKRYKASVLKAAVEGKLTEEWRKNHPNVEPADKFLERILTERRKKWEESELAKMKAKGKEPKDDKWKKRYIEPPQVDKALLPILPDGWTWASILQISSDTQIGLVRSKAEQNNDEEGVGYIKMNNITMDGRVIKDHLVFVNADESEIKRFNLKVGDILFNTRNSLELVGKVGLVKKNISDYIFNNNLMRIRVADGVNSSFIVFQMCSMQFRKKMERVKKATTNVAAIYAKDLMPLSIIVPPSDEQIELSKAIEQHYSIVEEIEISLEANFKRAERLRQSVLKKAFSGKLVKQILNDNSTGIMLNTVQI